MKNIELFDKTGCVYSYEIFPPKNNFSIETVKNIITDLNSHHPDFISITYGAGGSVKDNKTLEMCELVKKYTDIDPVAHLTCVSSTKQDIIEILDKLKQIGVTNILALRGDKNAESKQGDFVYASQMIEFIKQNYGDYFDISAACYPSGHFECKSQKEDILNLKKKVEAGANHLITQLFFDNQELYHFLELIDIADINVNIHAGIMPVTNIKQVQKMISLSGATVPTKLSKLIARYGDNNQAMQQAGINYATEQIVDLLTNDIKGIHLYTMNNVEIAKKITDNVRALL